jgi:hypothetical protein
MTTDEFGFYLQNILIQTVQIKGQLYSDTSPFSVPWFITQYPMQARKRGQAQTIRWTNRQTGRLERA